VNPRVVARGDLLWFVDSAHATTSVAHPHLVVSDDVFNRSRLPAVIVCALTSNPRRATEPGNVVLEPGEGGLERPSVVIVSQLSFAPKDRLGPHIGRLSDARVAEVLDGLRFQQASFFRR
jgi:mRNA interferase MazF